MPKPGCPEQSGLCDDAVTFLLWKVARPQAEHPLKKRNRGFAAAAASSFCSDAKGTKKSPGNVAFGKDLRLTPWSFMSHFSPDPRFLRGSQRDALALATGAETSGRVSNRYRCRSAQLTPFSLLQDDLRLSGSTYTAGGGRRSTSERCTPGTAPIIKRCRVLPLHR